MHLDLTRVRAPLDHVDRTYGAAAFEGVHEDFRVTGDVTLSLDVEKEGRQYRLTGHAATSLELVCSRCLEPFTWPVDATFDVTFLPQSSNAGEGEIEVGEDDLDCAFYESEVIDLGQLLREQFYLSLPMKPLCTPACPGLCPVCGTNRNTGTCGCDPRWIDPRLAPLRGLAGDEPGPS
jgi:uncharacterized protein